MRAVAIQCLMAMVVSVAHAERVPTETYVNVFLSPENRAASQAVFGVAWERGAAADATWTRVLAPGQSDFIGGMIAVLPGAWPRVDFVYPTFAVSGVAVDCEAVSVRQSVALAVTLVSDGASYRCALAPLESGQR